jgi:hypothetical protein
MMHRDMVIIFVIFVSKAAYHPELRRESFRNPEQAISLEHARDADFNRTIAASIC